MEISFGPITFSSKFDSGNLAAVEQVLTKEENGIDVLEHSDYEFNLWTMPDAAGTLYENGNRTWFYFSIRGPLASKSVRLNIMNLNRQSRLYRQGLLPLYKTTCSKSSSWQRIKEKVTFENDGPNFKISFIHRFMETTKLSTTYFAFCYPYSYNDCQQYISGLVEKHPLVDVDGTYKDDDIYLHQDTLIRSNDGLNIDLLTVTSMKGIKCQHEASLLGLFPDQHKKRPNIFKDKKIIFLTSRVHPGETPASFLFQGFLDFLLRKDDKRAIMLRDKFVFKLVPMLNPDGVKRGHYRTDIFGVNLNRTYQDPDIFRQPSIFAIKTLMMYHHFNRVDPGLGINKDLKSSSSFERFTVNDENDLLRKSKTEPCLPEGMLTKRELFSSCETINDIEEANDVESEQLPESEIIQNGNPSSDKLTIDSNFDGNKLFKRQPINRTIEEHDFQAQDNPDGVFVYIDLHGHASKRGCFMYGNNFVKEKDMIDCMLLPKLISLNSSHFDFLACNFTKKNMYHKDKKDGLSKEGSGRVSMFRALGIIHSYTLECNYNTGRATNPISNATCDNGRATPPPQPGFPPRYTPEHYEEVGRGTAIALLDLCNCNPWSRLPTSEYKTLNSVRDWLAKFIRNTTPKIPIVKTIPKTKPIGKSVISNYLMNKKSSSSPSTFTVVTPSKTNIDETVTFKSTLISTTGEKRKEYTGIYQHRFSYSTTKNKGLNDNDNNNDNSNPTVHSSKTTNSKNALKEKPVSTEQIKEIIGAHCPKSSPSERCSPKKKFDYQASKKREVLSPSIAKSTDLKQVFPNIDLIENEVANGLHLEDEKKVSRGEAPKSKRSPVSFKATQKKSVISSPSNIKKVVPLKGSKLSKTPDTSIDSTECSTTLASKANRRRKNTK